MLTSREAGKLWKEPGPVEESEELLEGDSCEEEEHGEDGDQAPDRRRPGGQKPPGECHER